MFQDGVKKTISTHSAHRFTTYLSWIRRTNLTTLVDTISEPISQEWQHRSQRPKRKRTGKYNAANTGFPSLPFQQFQVLFNSLFKVLCIFPSRYLYAIGLPPVFSFRWNLPPTWSCNPKQLDSMNTRLKDQANGGLTLSAALFQGTWPSPIVQAPTDHNSALN